MAAIQRFIVPGLRTPISHYCHAVRAGERIWVSGCVGARGDGTIPDNVVDQFRVALDNLDASLRAAGGRPEHVVKVTLFLTNVAERPLINPLREKYFGEHRPASTLVQVAALVDPCMRVEIEAEAVVAGA
ncbi:MAG: RidA family protein [Alphaproteobacteria bacterium]|nr:RidA family protein [Alphaproteobacteria bacterium]